MLPRTPSWSHRQKWLIVAAAVVLIAAFSALIYTYERHYRGPTDSVLVGTWQIEDGCIDCTNWITLRPNHNVVGFSDSLAGELINYWGRWYAGGALLVIHSDSKEEARSIVMRILDVAPDTIRVRWDGKDMRMKRSTRQPPGDTYL